MLRFQIALPIRNGIVIEVDGVIGQTGHSPARALHLGILLGEEARVFFEFGGLIRQTVDQSLTNTFIDFIGEKLGSRRRFIEGVVVGERAQHSIEVIVLSKDALTGRQHQHEKQSA